jgi:hypothetical protein
MVDLRSSVPVTRQMFRRRVSKSCEHRGLYAVVKRFPPVPKGISDIAYWLSSVIRCVSNQSSGTLSTSLAGARGA